jgi:hypothetical protein
MMGRHPKLPIDTILNLEENESLVPVTNFVEQHVERLKEAYRKAGEQLERATQAKEKMVKVSGDSNALEPGTAVLQRNRVIGRNKIQDALGEHEFIVLRRIDPEKHIYEVYRKDAPDDRRIVNRVYISGS